MKASARHNIHQVKSVNVQRVLLNSALKRFHQDSKNTTEGGV